VEEKIIAEGKVMRLTKLQSILVRMLKDKNIGAFARTSYLKCKLLQNYPVLKCFRPSKLNVSGVIYCEGKETMLLDQWESSSAESSESDSAATVQVSEGEDESESRPASRHSVRVPDGNELYTLYSAAMIVKGSLQDVSAIDCPWPPTSADLTVDSARHFVPVELYNFLSWCVGLAVDEPTLGTFASTDRESESKLLAICQDIVYLASRGKKNLLLKHSH